MKAKPTKGCNACGDADEHTGCLGRKLLAVERTTLYFIANDDVGRSASPGESHVTKSCKCVEDTPFNIMYFVINN